jgi:hypothetical protein
LTGEEKEPITDRKLDSAPAAEPVQHEEQIDREDEFRVKVGTRLAEVHPPVTSFFQTSKGISLILSAGVVIAVLVTILLLAGRRDDPPPAANTRGLNTRYVPQRQDVVGGKIAIKASGLAQYPIKIQPEMYEAALKGRFASDDGGDMIAIVAEDTEYQNWISGRPTQVLWGTENRRTSGTFDVPLRPGTYHLVFSNKFSAHSDKIVSVEAVLNFKRLETY